MSKTILDCQHGVVTGFKIEITIAYQPRFISIWDLQILRSNYYGTIYNF